MTKTDFFPPIEADRTGYLRLDDRHAMYWEEAGNPDGVPMLFLHGGPGAGTFPMHRDRKSTRLNSSHIQKSRMPSSA